MTRLIDADAFRKWLCSLFAGSGTHEDDTKEDEEWNASLARIITHLDEAPTAGIIFCCECEYYKTPQRYAYKEPNPYCCRSALVKMSENDFCSKAKKREEIKNEA